MIMRLLLSVAAVSVFAFSNGMAQEQGPPGPPEKPGRGGAGNPVREYIRELEQKGFTKEKLRELIRKARAGEQLTPEEQEIANKLRELRAAQRGGRGVGQQGRRGLSPWMQMARRQVSPFVKVKMNPLDAAYHAMAEAYYAAQKYVEAADSLKYIAENSPDEGARNAAHFNRASVYRRGLGYYSHAAEEYFKVKGILRERALREVVAMFEEANDMELAINTLTELANATKDVGERIQILRTLALAYTRAKKFDASVETLRQITQLIDYDKAVQMKDYYTEGDPEDVLKGKSPMPMMRFIRRNRGVRGGLNFRSERRLRQERPGRDNAPPGPRKAPPEDAAPRQ